MSDHTYIQLVLALQLALVVALGGVWSWSRWNRWQVWLGGIPVLLAALWILSSVSTQMLPNLL
jgi:sortase A